MCFGKQQVFAHIRSQRPTEVLSLVVAVGDIETEGGTNMPLILAYLLVSVAMAVPLGVDVPAEVLALDPRAGVEPGALGERQVVALGFIVDGFQYAEREVQIVQLAPPVAFRRTYRECRSGARRASREIEGVEHDRH